MNARITAIGRQEIKSFDLDEETIIVGRDKSCDIPIKDPSLERRHAALSQSGSAQITDLQSRSGTFLNGRRIERATLGDGDRLRVGDTIMIVSIPLDVESDRLSRRELLIADDERYFIRIAKHWGILDRPRIREILLTKSQDHILGNGRRVEEICVQKRFLSVDKVREIFSVWEHLVIVCRSCSSVYTPGDLRRSRRLMCSACHEPLRGPLEFPVSRSIEKLNPERDDSSLHLREGDQYAGCTIECRLHENDTAMVYRASHQGTRGRVAIKILKNSWAIDWNAHRFVEEARKVSNIEHPHIVPILNVGYERDHYFVVYQFLEGRTLAEQIRERGPLTPERARYVAAAAASALHEAHRHLVFHGDVRPENIHVGRNRVVKLMELGTIPKIATDSAHSHRSVSSVLYTSPEVESGEPSDARSDVYGLGLTLRAMLLGKSPPSDHRYIELSSPEDEDPRVPRALSDIVMQMIQKDPEDRYQSMREVIQALRVADPFVTESQDALIPETKQLSRNPRWGVRRLIQTALLLLLLVSAGFIGTLVSMNKNERADTMAKLLGPLSDFASGVAQAESPPTGKGNLPALADITPAYALPENVRSRLLQAFNRRDFTTLCEILEKDPILQAPSAAEYKQNALSAFAPFTRYTRVPGRGEFESYVRNKPVTFEEYDQFIRPPQNGEYIERIRSGWWNERYWTARIRDLKHFRKENAPFIFASYYEAEAYCLWVTERWEEEGLNYTFRLPTSHDFKDRLPELSAWIRDPSEEPEKHYVFSKNGSSILVDYDAITHQPTIRLVVDIPVASINELEKIILGSE